MTEAAVVVHARFELMQGQKHVLTNIVLLLPLDAELPRIPSNDPAVVLDELRPRRVSLAGAAVVNASQ